MALIIVIAVILGFVEIAMLADAQRDHFGVLGGNQLLTLEFLVLAGTSVTYATWHKAHPRRAVGLISIQLSLAFAFLGWFVHPDEVYSRALQRTADWERVIADHNFARESGEEVDDSPKMRQRLTRELRARQYEYKAAEMRYEGDKEFFRSTHFSMLWYAVAGLLAAVGGVGLVQEFRRKA
jgi:hypothetical protein